MPLILPEIWYMYITHMKHIFIDIHFVRDLGRHQKLKIQHVSPMDQSTDCLTKPLSRVHEFLDINSNQAI